MARVTPMKMADIGLDSIINVSAKVGRRSEGGVNNKNDVDAVEQLILLIATSQFGFDGQTITNNGQIDSTTLYYIFMSQWWLKNKGGYASQIIDGMISPAMSSGYGGNSIYTIVALNRSAKKLDATGYQQFRNNFICSD